jgi:hypothetical protein
MLRATNRLTIRVPHMPTLRRQDQTAHQPAVHQLHPPAGSTSSATNQTRRHDRRPLPPSTAMSRVRVLAPRRRHPHQRLAPGRAIALVLGERRVLAPAAVAAADAVGGGDSSPECGPSTCLAPAAQGLVAVMRVERSGAALAALQHEESRVSGRQLECRGIDRASVARANDAPAVRPYRRGARENPS